MILAYHGTGPEAYKLIGHEGFREGTWFAYDLGNAMKFGGMYVFAVPFDVGEIQGADIGEEKWQFWIREALPPDVILWARYFTYEGLVIGDSLARRTFEQVEQAMQNWLNRTAVGYPRLFH